ncbi:helix-turn-helix transcriptional regulator [Eoetvoesia caeni]|nr:helix-turn-helix transcriptional regulator [Eoetvoesiella caeni]
MTMQCDQEAPNFRQKDCPPPDKNDRCHPFMALKALTQPTRMEIFRMVHSSADGECADVIASRFSGPLSNISLHLAVLSRAGLIVGQRQEHDVVYRSNPQAVEDLLCYVLGIKTHWQFAPGARRHD